MAISEKIRNLGLKSTRIFTLNDKVKEKPVILLKNTDLFTNKKGNARDVQLGKCYDFLGTNEYVSVPDHDDFSFTDDAGTDYSFSVSAWVYIDNFMLNNPVLSKDGVASGIREWLLNVTIDGEVIFYVTEPDSSGVIGRRTNGFTCPSGEWVHLTATYDGAKISSGFRIYADGIRIDDADYESGSYDGMSNTSQPVQIGHFGNFGTYRIDGKIYDARIHSKELSAVEVDRVMFGGASSHEVGWWKFDEGSGAIAYDSSGRNHYGVIKNATLATLHVTDSSLPYSFQNNYGFNIAKLYNSSTTTSTTSTSTTTTSTSSTSTSSSTTSSSTTSTSSSTTSSSTSTSISTSTTSTTSLSTSSTSSTTTTV